MKKLLSKLALFLTGTAMAIGVGVAAFNNGFNEVRADTYTSTYLATTSVPASGDTLEASTSDPAEATYIWTTDATAVYTNYIEDTRGIQAGSGSASCSYVRLASTSFNSYVITSVSVKARSNGVNPTISISIGGHSFPSQDIDATYKTFSFDNSTSNYSGELIVNLEKDAGVKYLLFASITVTYTDVSKNITSLSASLNDNQKVFYATESITTSDIKLVVSYDDSTSDVITNGAGLTITSGNPLVSGENTIGLSFTNVYGTETTSFSFNAKPEKLLNHYSITGDLTKKDYYDGDDWDLSGLVLNAYYTSGEEELDPVEVGSVVDLKTAGDLILTLNPATALYGTKKLNIGAIQYLAVDVASVKINGIQVQEQRKFVKYTASTLEDGNYALVSGDITKAMNNIDVTNQPNSNRRLGISEAIISANKLIAPIDEIIFKITKIDDENDYFVIQDTNDKYVVRPSNAGDGDPYISVESINGSVPARAKWTVAYYEETQTFDFYNVDASTRRIRLNQGLSFFGTYPSTSGSGGPLTLYKEPVPLVSIEAERTDLGIGDEITVTATPINGATGIATIEVDDDSLINFVDNGDNTATISVKDGILTSGEVVVTATLNESSVSILLNISNVVELSSIAIKTSPKLNYNAGEVLDLSGLEVEATFSDGHKEDVTNNIAAIDISGVDMNTKGSYELTISYTYLELTRTTKMTVVVSYKVVTVAEAIEQINTEGGTTALIYEIHGIVCKKGKIDGKTEVFISDRYNETDDDKMIRLYNLDSNSKSNLVVGAWAHIEAKLKIYSGEYQTVSPILLDYDDDPDPVVRQISIGSAPKKKTYVVGDTIFDWSGLSIEVYTNQKSGTDHTDSYDTDPEAFLNTYEITGPDTSHENGGKASVPVFVTHKESGFSTSFTVSIEYANVKNISITKEPNKTHYASGELFDPTGIEITANRNNNSSYVVTDANSLTYKTKQGDGKVYDGDTYVTVTYSVDYETASGIEKKDFSTNIQISVAERYVVSISAYFSSSGLNKDTYDINTEFNTDSLVIKTTYNDGYEETFHKGNFSKFRITPPNMSTYGDKDVLIELKGTSFSTTIKIHIRGIEILSIDTKPYRLTYRVGDELDFNGIEISAMYSDSTIEDVKINWDGVTVTGDASKDGPQQEITISYKGQSDSFKIDVWMTDKGMATLIASEIAKLRALYVQDDYTDENWTKVQKIINDTEAVLDEFDPRNDGEHYSSDVMEWINNAKEEINAIPVRSLSKITVSGPTKTSYVVGDELDLTGLVVTAHFEDGSTKVLESGKYSLSEVDMSTTGQKTITVTYGNKTASFVITVNEPVDPSEKVLESIAISGTIKNTYVIGEDLDTSGLVVTATYSDQSSQIVTGWTVSGYDKNTKGEQTITVSYTENGVTKTATFTVTVAENPVDPALEEARENAIAEYKDFFDSIDLSGYSEEIIAQFNALKEEALAALGEAATEEEIAAALSNAKAALNNLLAANPKPVPTNTNLGLILGLSIGGGVLLAGGVVALVLILKKKKKVA